MFKTAILILLYNKEINESNTITSLLKSKVQCQNARIVIWNNGPNQLENSDGERLKGLGYDVTIEETLNNESLAVIYNQFITENKADKYIFLDDDSELNPSYILTSSEIKKTEVGMPIISSLGEIRSPTIDGTAYSTEAKLSLKSKVITIGSGLVIGADITDKLKENYNQTFDERFYLYGVDTTFCLRLFNSKLTNKIKIIPGFEHSLSRLEKESVAIKNFRKKELSYNLGLTLRYYVTGRKFYYRFFSVILGYIIRMLMRKKNMISLSGFLTALINGKHYRNFN